jgi:hypothetical protein
MPVPLADHLFPLLLSLFVFAYACAGVLIMVRGERMRAHAESLHLLSRHLLVERPSSSDQRNVDAAFVRIVAAYHRKR